MVTRVNTHALGATRIDSAELGPLGMIAHPMPQPGAFSGSVLAGDVEVAGFQLEVSDDAEKGQVDLDLANIVPSHIAVEPRTIRLKLKRDGFVVFFVSEGRGGYRILIEARPGEVERDSRPEPVFDSAMLRQNDVFVATLIRPGAWGVSERHSGQRATVTVRYPDVAAAAPYRLPEEATVIRVTEAGMEPDAVEIGPGAGVAFLVERDGVAIAVELTESDEGPAREGGRPEAAGRRRVRWTNPRHAGR